MSGDLAGADAFDPAHVYQLLQDACRSLEGMEEHAAAAHVAHAMAMVEAAFHVGSDHRDES